MGGSLLGFVDDCHCQFSGEGPETLGSIEPDYVDHLASIVNGQRRQGLDFKSPTELYAAATVQ